MSKWKIPNSAGFTALINTLKQTKKTSDALVSDVSALQGDLAKLASYAGETFAQIDEILGAINNLSVGQFTLPTNDVAWGTDNSNHKYPRFYDITVNGITENDVATVIIEPEYRDAAYECGMSDMNQTLDGVIRVRACRVPTQAISGKYLIQVREITETGEGAE